MLNVRVQENEEAVVLHCNGALVRGEETNLLCTAVHHHGKNVILDLSGVTSIDAGGIGALIALQSAGIYLQLENPTKTVREVLRVTGMDSVFEIRDLSATALPFANAPIASVLACCGD